MIRVENISKKYDQTLALDNVSFGISKGEIVGLLGPNGAGKTTALRIIAGILPATSGKVFLSGIDMLEDPIAAKRHLGYMPENVAPYLDMEVREYLTFFAKLLHAPKDKLKSHLDKILEKTGLAKVQKKLIATLSKGYKQRVGLAQALLGGPDVLILDEPTIGLDPIQIIEIRKLIKDLAKEQTVVLSSHILPEVSATCSRVLIINGGRIVADGTPEELAKYKKGLRIVLVRIRGDKTEVMQRLESLSIIKKVTPESSSMPNINTYKVETLDERAEEKIAQTIIHYGWALQELKPEHLELEDIFLRLTAKEKGKD